MVKQNCRIDSFPDELLSTYSFKHFNILRQTPSGSMYQTNHMHQILYMHPAEY